MSILEKLPASYRFTEKDVDRAGDIFMKTMELNDEAELACAQRNALKKFLQHQTKRKERETNGL